MYFSSFFLACDHYCSNYPQSCSEGMTIFDIFWLLGLIPLRGTVLQVHRQMEGGAFQLPVQINCLLIGGRERERHKKIQEFVYVVIELPLIWISWSKIITKNKWMPHMNNSNVNLKKVHVPMHLWFFKIQNVHLANSLLKLILR